MNTTPLESLHTKYKARMSPFGGWNLPLQFEGPLLEHRWVRERAGIFDISHMGRIHVWGPSAAEYFETFTTLNVLDLPVNRARYGLALDPAGFIVDDVYLFRLDSDEFLFVVNASNRQRILEEFFISRSNDFSLSYEDLTFSTVMIALQGPYSGKVWRESGGRNLPEARNEVWIEKSAIVSRTGYTGEFGIELIVPKNEGPSLWQRLLDHPDVKPIGLAARDSLRFEAGYMLYGHEIDRTLRPQDTILGWALRRKRLEQIIGWQDFHKIPPHSRLVWFTMEEKAVPRQDYLVFDERKVLLGKVASGMYSPTNDIFAGNARIVITSDLKAIDSGNLFIEIRGTLKAARILAPPLYNGGIHYKE